MIWDRMMRAFFGGVEGRGRERGELFQNLLLHLLLHLNLPDSWCLGLGEKRREWGKK